MTDRRVTLDDLGAWLIKGNADAADLVGRFARDPRVSGWCVRPGYRARLMRAGQPVVFWASGSRGRLRYGVWGLGRVTGPAEPGEPGSPWSVPLDLTILAEPSRLTRRELGADPRLADLEVLRQPQAANPSYLTVAQFAALCQHLPTG
ncbi:EVE domain-containing protein [Plantactinospora siamensis]|uniref:EVE domain-containing protein n=1 Tax=Plantactinospora siamensis TaxID=555372 RepID=A0ABV6NQ59_9ACTN